MLRRPQERQIPTTSYAVLGLLTFREMSGYDLKQLADASIKHFFWSPASSQIYGELRRLRGLGYVTEREVAQERRPDKRLYRITPEGEEVLHRWLEKPVEDLDVVKSSALLKLFFGRLVSTESVVAQIEEYRRQAQELLEQFEAIEGRIASREGLFFPYLTLRSGLTRAKATILWADEALDMIRTRQSQQTD